MILLMTMQMTLYLLLSREYYKLTIMLRFMSFLSFCPFNHTTIRGGHPTRVRVADKHHYNDGVRSKHLEKYLRRDYALRAVNFRHGPFSGLSIRMRIVVEAQKMEKEFIRAQNFFLIDHSRTEILDQQNTQLLIPD